MAELVTSGELQRHIAGKLQPAYQKRYTSMLNAITKYLIPLGITLPLRTDGEIVGGYFLWLTLPHPLSADDVAKRAKTEENLIIAPGSLFTVYGDTEGSSNLERNFRLCFAWEDEKLLEEGIQRLGVVVEAMLKESKGGHVPQESNASGSIADLTKYQ